MPTWRSVRGPPTSWYEGSTRPNSSDPLKGCACRHDMAAVVKNPESKSCLSMVHYLDSELVLWVSQYIVKSAQRRYVAVEVKIKYIALMRHVICPFKFDVQRIAFAYTQQLAVDAKFQAVAVHRKLRVTNGFPLPPSCIAFDGDPPIFRRETV